MHKELVKMINIGDLSAKQFFTMSPYSGISNKYYAKVSKFTNFFEDMYLISNKTYERLAKIAYMTGNNPTNCLIVTGYSGSGKTNFLRYCEAILNGRAQIKSYKESLGETKNLFRGILSTDGVNEDDPSFFDEIEKETKRVNEIKKIEKAYADSLNKIQETLSHNYFEKSTDYVGENISFYLNETLKGKTVFFDFDTGKKERKVPLELKLTRLIESHLEHARPSVIESMCDFYRRNQDNFTLAFENRCAYLFEKVILFIDAHKFADFSEYKYTLLDVLKDLDIDQLLCIETLLGIAEALDNSSKDNVFYFLDNIDMLSGDSNDVLIQTIEKFWDFTSEIQSLMNCLCDENSELNQPWIEAYNRFRFIFSMRETTAMHIGDHLRTRIKEYAIHFDISTDINKSFVIKKRYDHIKVHIDNNEITNKSFLYALQNIERFTEDKYFKWNFFSLFNDDYRKVINLLCRICVNNYSPLKEAIPLLQTKIPYIKFGGRGIVIKTLCDFFKGCNYFNYLKVPMPGKGKGGAYNITLSRIILTVLSYLQNNFGFEQEDDSSFFILREQSVTIKELYENVKIFCRSDNDFLLCIEKMFAGRNWEFWDHLVTFDNVLEYSRETIKKGLTDDSGEHDVYIRCTEAGIRYLNAFCVHFEFFSSRYAEKNTGLFSCSSYSLVGKTYGFCKQLDQVYTAVSDCCKELKKINNIILEEYNYSEYESILDSPFVVNNQFHEERLIHSHISYIDAYRLYLIRGPLQADTANINRTLIRYVKKYLELLKYEGEHFYSTNSENLYTELYECIKLIESKNYNDTAISISRNYYYDHIKECNYHVTPL